MVPLTLYVLGPWFVRIVSIRRDVLYASIAVIALVGCYVATYSIFQMGLALVFGVLAFLLRRQGYPVACLLLGFVLQLAFAAPTIAAEVIGGAMGMSMAQAADPGTGGTTTAFGQYFIIRIT